MVNEMVDDEPKSLGRCSVFTYGVGHMLNDITSSCWYTYLLLYLTDIGLSPRFLLYLLTHSICVFPPLFFEIHLLIKPL